MCARRAQLSCRTVVRALGRHRDRGCCGFGVAPILGEAKAVTMARSGSRRRCGGRAARYRGGVARPRLVREPYTTNGSARRKVAQVQALWVADPVSDVTDKTTEHIAHSFRMTSRRGRPSVICMSPTSDASERGRYQDLRERNERVRQRHEQFIEQLAQREGTHRLDSFRKPSPTVELADIESIEGPAPAEDSSVPPDSPPGA